MADGLCGPSNALQNFQKHSTVDRTLQQDRLISRPHPSQGFRSTPGASAGRLDSEFEAFQAGHLPLAPHQPPFQQHLPYALPHAIQQPGPGPSPGWVNDFQRLNTSNPALQPQQARLNHQHQRQDGGGWHQDFRQQFQAEQQGVSQPQLQGGAASQFSPMMQRGVGMHPGMQPQYTGSIGGAQNHQEPAQPVEAFDEAAFARAFEDAALEETSQERESQPREQSGMTAQQDVLLAESAERFMTSALPPEDSSIPAVPDQARIGADLIHDPSDTSQPQADDPDALARTAGQLLDSVSDNTSEKFQKSQFLQLMRQFRDRELLVEGDKIVGRGTDQNGTGIAGEGQPPHGAGNEDTNSVQP